jgi:uncharacterized membrane protein
MKKYIKEYINNDFNFSKKQLIGIVCLVIALSGVFGFIYEFIFYFFNSGFKTFYYRGGNFLPWINIYAYGALLIILLTYKRRKNPLIVFLISLFICGLLEYFAGWLVNEVLHSIRCWDYNQEILNFGNINGYVCLRSVLFFGLSGLILIYGMLPLIFYIAQKVSVKKFLIISIIICSFFLIDEIYNLIFTELFNLPRASFFYKKLGFKYIYFN